MKAADAKKTATGADTKAADARKIAEEALAKVGVLPPQIVQVQQTQTIIQNQITNVTNTQNRDASQLQDLRRDVDSLKQEDKVKLDEIDNLMKRRSQEFALAVPALVAAGVALSSPTLINATKTGICQSTQPGGCMRQGLDGLGNSLGNRFDNLLNGFNAGANAFQIGKLNQISGQVAQVNNKLGAQLPGGIGGFLGRIFNKTTEIASKVSEGFDKVYKAAHLDKAVQLLTLAATVHNATMLSRNVGYTLGSAISNTLAAVGIKDPKTGSPLDIGAIFNKQVTDLLKAVLGVETYNHVNAQWKRASAIYNSASQIIWSIQSIGYSLQSALEVVGSHVAWIGNALRRFDVVGERAYRWMNPTPNFSNSFFTTLEKIETGASSVDQVASEALSIQETLTQLNQQKADLIKAVSQDPTAPKKPEVPEARETKTAEDAIKAISTARDVLLGAADAPGGV